MPQQMCSGISKLKYLCRWWIRSRIIKNQPSSIIEIEGKTYQLPLHEFYCPFWAKPLDFIWKLIFGKPTIKEI